MIPVYINNRDLLTWPRAMLWIMSQWEECEPIIVDNASTYPPLLEWYDTKCTCRVIRLPTNRGPRAAWDVMNHKNDFFAITDSDLGLSRLPNSTLVYFRDLLEASPNVCKVGSALEINDLPGTDVAAMAKAREVGYWHRSHEGMKDHYSADIDTTLAIYRTGQKCTYGPAIRVAGQYTARHMPWYIKPDKIAPDYAYYLEHLEHQGVLVYSPVLKKQSEKQ